MIAQADLTPVINPTGNARLATAGTTGDVLAGVIGATYPRPANGIFVAITVWNITLASKGKLAM